MGTVDPPDGHAPAAADPATARRPGSAPLTDHPRSDTTGLRHDSLDGLRTRVTGGLITPEDDGYDDARRVWNADIDRRPAVIVQCASAHDVAAAVTVAADEGVEIAVRGGGHSMSGASVVDGGMVIDLGRLNHVVVDPDTRRARVGGGALLGDLDAATQQHGLAVPSGVVSHTGVGGLTLGGGMGWLTRKAGLTIDNLVSAEIVTADGEIRHVSAQDDPDLFWAIRGGGGNFGVVTQFEFRLIEAGPIVHLGLLFWGLDQGREVLRLAREVMATLPPDLNMIIAGLQAPPAPFVPEQHQLQPGYALLVTGFSSGDEHEGLLNRIRGALPPVWEYVTPMPYVALQQMLDEPNAWGFHDYDKGAYLEELSDAAIDVIVKHLPGKSSPLSVLLLYRLDQAYSEIPDDATAFSGGRSPRYAVFIVAVCPAPDLLVSDRAWVRELWQALQPYTPHFGLYVNALTDADDDRVRSAYGPDKYRRLARIKAAYDPGNLFHHNSNIKPAQQRAGWQAGQ
ncbi:putative FAD linked 6-hydroxy-d-nicotine oxidase [Blastococcus saxobsidens DD2]|uniref:Putative FAD linked 6-hydroxy-d-nicotine oxidase n=1 Tax=Blastococcus saxobsidens (strain DD2) TaxID=1146883 RepID=H6RM30_BLASD|nr:putative FAD linked 6-hydroxy-d-nicotine oxidase [Blastococcus saxobsidens DD2]